MRELALENPIRAIRDISYDLTGTRTVKLANGREMSALDLQEEYMTKALGHADSQGLLEPGSLAARAAELWARTLQAVRKEDPSLVDTEIDWAIKQRLINRYMNKHDLDLGSARVAQLDLAYHDVTRSRGLFYLLQGSGQAARVTDDVRIFEAKTVPPQTTRAKLRGDFIRRAQERRRDFTVDWVHLKLNDQSQRTVLCKDPFRSVDERVARLIESM